MAISVKLSDELVGEAKRYASVYSRSTPKQLEYWMNIGKIAEDNPDLSFQFIKEILLAKAEAEDGELTPYTFG